jgi:uncharacterized protein with NAD-binding domain and iron-sulfur cluster
MSDAFFTATKAIANVVAVTALVLGASSSAFATTCLRSQDIRGHELINDRTLHFYMNDGTVYRNQMKTPCSGLRFSGYVHRSFNGQLCEGAILRVLQSPEICSLGKFEKLAKASANAEGR